jgi:hypothetical protein
LLERSTFWIIPFLTIWAVSGILDSVNFFLLKIKSIQIYAAVYSWALILLIFIGGIYPLSVDPSNQTESSKDAETITAQLKPRIDNESIVVVSEKADAEYWYYFDYLGIPQRSIRSIKTRPFNKAFIIIDGHETLDEVTQGYGPGSQFLKMDQVQKIVHFDYTTLYEIPANESAIKSAFPNYQGF